MVTWPSPPPAWSTATSPGRTKVTSTALGASSTATSNVPSAAGRTATSFTSKTGRNLETFGTTSFGNGRYLTVEPASAGSLTAATLPVGSTFCRAPFGPTVTVTGNWAVPARATLTGGALGFAAAGVIFTVAVLAAIAEAAGLKTTLKEQVLLPAANPKFGLARQLIPAVGAARAKSLKFGLAGSSWIAVAAEKSMAAPL